MILVREHTFAEAQAAWLSWLTHEANRSPATIHGYRWELSRLSRFLQAHGHSMLMADLSREDLRAYMRSRAHLNPTSRNRALGAIRSWLGWLAREELIDRDPSARLVRARTAQALPKPMTAEDLARVLQWAARSASTHIERRDRALVMFLISTGCRIAEALQLDRSDLAPRALQLMVMGKGSKERPVYLTDDARAALDCYLEARRDDDPALFVNFDTVHRSRGRRLTTDGARKIVRRLQRDLGAWSFRSPHVARHTAATALLEVTGGDVRLVQEVLGHANLATMSRYTAITDRRKLDAYERYQQALAAQQ